MNKSYLLAILPNASTWERIKYFQQILRSIVIHPTQIRSHIGFLSLLEFRSSEAEYYAIRNQINTVLANLAPFQFALSGLSSSPLSTGIDIWNLCLEKKAYNTLSHYGQLLQYQLDNNCNTSIKYNYKHLQFSIGYKDITCTDDPPVQLLPDFTASQVCFYFTMLQYDDSLQSFIPIEQVPLLGLAQIGLSNEEESITPYRVNSSH